MFTRRLAKSLVLGLLIVIGSGCSGDENGDPAGPSENSDSWVGTWLILSAGGQDISGMGQTMVITATTITHNVPGFCTEKWSYTVNGNAWSSEVIETNCLGGDPVGMKRTGTFSITGKRMTWQSQGSTIVMERQ